MKSNKYTFTAVLIVFLVTFGSAIDSEARERGERMRAPRVIAPAPTPPPPPPTDPVIIPKETLEEWKEDIENGNIDDVIEEYEEIIGDGAPSGSGEEEVVEEEQNPNPRTREITRDRTRGGHTPPPPPPAEDTTNDGEEENQQEESTESFEATYLEKVEAEIHRLTNIERDKANLAALLHNNQLQETAEDHSDFMAETGLFSHVEVYEDGSSCDLTCRLQETDVEASSWGENIAWRSSTKLPDAEELAQAFIQSWMNSQGHRDNILSDDFNAQGVGLSQTGNTVFVTVNFARTD